MRTIPSGFLDSPVTDLAICWRVTRRDGEIIYGTEYDKDLVIGDSSSSYFGTYQSRAGITGSDIRSTADLSVDNLEVEGALQDDGDLLLFDLSAADIEAGVFDNAEVVTFLVNATDPDLYQHELRCGWMGNISRDAEGRYKTEVRGLTQALSQGVTRTYSIACDAELGDVRCKVDMTAHTTTGTVATVETGNERREFAYSGGSLQAFGLVPGGTITWNTGDNAGYAMEIKTHDAGPQLITLWLPMPRDIAAGDTFTFRAGCDKSKAVCKDTYDNLLNRRAHAIFVPGDLQILKVGKR